MFVFKNIKKQKGYILLYTLIISLLCMMIVMLSFKLIIDEKEDIHYLEKYVLREKLDKKYKEYLLASLSGIIKANSVPISNEGIINYFRSLDGTEIAHFNKSYVTYSLLLDSFIITYEFEAGSLQSDEYSYVVTNNIIKYTFKNSTYESGSVNVP